MKEPIPDGSGTGRCPRLPFQAPPICRSPCRETLSFLNSWEAAYFQFDEGLLMKLAKAAADAGIELFVLDDGWFGKRNDDTSSLGDWTENRKKLPGGLKGLSGKIKSLGMDFGIWVEPEMVNVDSGLYRNHPEWA
ncbi:alpha-galactosidase, partial [Mobilibacterium timonense]|uniref:alpha-galactosidase n=1 Tax=Mobilibacterium timonense TaxID=1871012 RepID=UPI003A9440BF